MRVGIAKTRVMVAASLLLALGLMTGCKPSDDKDHKPTPPSVVTPKPVERVELMPAESDEFLRRHFIDANGFEVETRIEYRNGDKAVIKFRSDRTQEQYKRTAKDGKVLIEQNFAADGKSIVSGQELRSDGTLKWKATQDSTGAVKTVTYWYDGKTLFSEKTQQSPGGPYETKFYRKDGKLWTTRSGPSDGVAAQEAQYDTNGKLVATIDRSGKDTVVTLYRADGTPQYRQHMTETNSSYGNYVYRTMLYVEELGADGKTVVRKLVMNSGGYSVVQVERRNSDGTVTVRDINYNGTVTHEEKRDSTGNVLSAKDFAPSDGVKEDYEWRAVREPSLEDPVNQWDMQERYPYYRR